MSVTFGYFSHDSGTREAAERLRVWMSDRIGEPMVLRYAGGYEALAREVDAATVDVAWLPPVVYVRLPPGRAEPLVSVVRGEQTGYESVLLVRADSPIHTLAELRQSRAAWVDAWSASGFVVPRVGLKSMGVDPRTLFRVEAFHGSHRAAIRAVVDGAADVTGTHAGPDEATGSGEEWTGVTGVAMRVLHSFGAVPSDLIAVRTALAPEARARLRDAFVAAGEGPMKEEIRLIFGADAFRTDGGSDYDSFRTGLAKADADGLFR